MADQVFPAHTPTLKKTDGEIIRAEHPLEAFELQPNQIRNEISALFFGMQIPVSGMTDTLEFDGDRLSKIYHDCPVAVSSWTWLLDQIQMIVTVFSAADMSVTKTKTFTFTGDKLTRVD